MEESTNLPAEVSAEQEVPFAEQLGRKWSEFQRLWQTRSNSGRATGKQRGISRQQMLVLMGVTVGGSFLTACDKMIHDYDNTFGVCVDLKDCDK